MTSFPTTAVEEAIKSAIRGKLNAYNPEPAVMPFHTRLLGRDRLALYSFIQSLNTTFGTSIYEPVAKELAERNFDKVDLQVKPPSTMAISTLNKIDEIVRELEAGIIFPDRNEHYSELRSALQDSLKKVPVKLTDIDIMLRRGHELYLIDIKTVKPNKGDFEKFKRTLLEWLGTYLEEDPNLEIFPTIAIPYNPYEPKPYKRWTMRGMIDIQNELKVAAEFWDFLGGTGAYDELLDCFERAGIDLRDEIDRYFSRFRTTGS
ncbi:MAG: TdeIII family type II restriction endonuclease [Chloroflexota bacterium]|nr:TdeIII family type II restriction endonuclease [Chloroflexota bacterium]